MWVRNTSSYDTEEVKRLVAFATRGVNMTRVCVNVKGSAQRRWAGRAYGYIPSYSNAPRTAKYLISLRFGEWTGPIPDHDYHGRSPEQKPDSRFPFLRFDTWQEMIIGLAAHEAQHVHQFRHGKRRSEVRCERFAARALARWREETA